MYKLLTPFRSIFRNFSRYLIFALLLLLLLALKTGVVKVEQIKETAGFLTGVFPLLFVPGAVGVMELWDILGALWLPILLALIPVTILVFAASGWVTQWIAGRKKHD